MQEELTEEQILTLKESLLKLEAQLRAILEQTEEQGKPVDLDEPIGRLSRMDAIQQQKMQSAGREAQKIQLAQVRRALTAIEDDEYGFCRRCEEPVGFRRLEIQPEAPFCVRCQDAREKNR